jgi:hypothetical protein
MTRDLAPWDDHSFEIWVLNEAPMSSWVKRWDVSFQLHKAEVYESQDNYVREDYFDWLQEKHGKPVYMQEVDERVPDSVRYPLDEIILTLPGGELSWFESSISYQVYGASIVSNTEYSYQLPNWVYWVGVAAGMKANLELKSGQVHFNKRLYGYEGELQIDQLYFADRVQELEIKWNRADRDLKRAQARIDQAMLDSNFDLVAELVSEYENAALNCGKLAGSLGEAERYSERETPIPRQEFEFASAKAQREGEESRVLMYHTGGKSEYVWNIWKTHGVNEALMQLRVFLQEKGKYSYDTGAKLGIHEENLLYMMEYDDRVTKAGQRKLVRPSPVGVLDPEDIVKSDPVIQPDEDRSNGRFDQ